MADTRLIPTDAEQLVASLYQATQQVRNSPDKPGSAAHFLDRPEDPVAPVVLRPVAEPAQMQARSSLEAEAAALGTLPPSPATMRGRLGAVVVRAIDRLTWWHSARLQRFGAALIAFLRTKSEEQDAVSARMNRLEAALQDQKMQLQAALRSMDALQQSVNESRFIARMDAQFALVNEQFASIYRQLEADRKRTADLEHWAQVHAGRMFAAAESLRADLHALGRRVAATGRPGEDLSTRESDSANAAIIDDRFYAALQDRFRGSREEIKRRQERYVPILRDAGVGTARAPIIDLGCGRGEWLELLQSSGLNGFGIDSNDEMVRACEARNLPVRKADWFAYLSTLPDGSAGAITSFHMIEHLPFGMLMALVNEARRALRPGGMLILETPNPANVMVGSNTFYLDPTHVKPIPKELLWVVLETRGFQHLQILELHPPAGFEGIEGPAPIVERFSAALDYAIIGVRY